MRFHLRASWVRHRVRQVRAVVAGSLIGGVVCVGNIYFGLKTGMSLGSSFTGAILGFAALSPFPCVQPVPPCYPPRRLRLALQLTWACVPLKVDIPFIRAGAAPR